jgi:2',3'-cyclic-nucleotide 2'-phosphodiesterase (5'-nucleotidase family)
LARRATLFKQERAENDGLILALDAGSSLIGDWVTLKSEGRAMVEAMNALGYDALTVGRLDMSSGLEAAQERAKEANFPFLSANMVGIDDNELIFQPYTVIDRYGVQIGIIGLSELQASQAPGTTDKVAMLDAREAAEKYVAELRDQVDLLIVLSHLGMEEDKALAAAVPGIDIIIGGNTRKLMNEPDRVGDTLVVQQGYRGEWVGILEASYDADGVLVEARERVITMGPDYVDDPDMQELLNKWREMYPTNTPAPTPVLTETPTEYP